jgi:hypothetical protein
VRQLGFRPTASRMATARMHRTSRPRRSGSRAAAARPAPCGHAACSSVSRRRSPRAPSPACAEVLTRCAVDAGASRTSRCWRRRRPAGAVQRAIGPSPVPAGA